MNVKRVRGIARLALGLMGWGLLPLAAEAASPSQSRPRDRTTQLVEQHRPKPTVRSSSRSRRSRRTRLARARAAARLRELREAAIPRYKLDASGSLVPDLRAEAAIIYNADKDQVLWEENSQDTRSIASITKVMTALVALEGDADVTQAVTVERSDVRGASTTYLRANERLTVEALLHLLLIASDNAAARALARLGVDGSEGFLARMNDKAIELGLAKTAYADPSGLDAANVSSAYDMARLITYAVGDERIATVMRKADYSVVTNRRVFTIHNTNQLVRRGDVEVRGGKTGFITKAGYCLATLLRLPQGNQHVAVVVLGARSNAGRFMETRHLLNWLSSKAQELFTPSPQLEF